MLDLGSPEGGQVACDALLRRDILVNLAGRKDGAVSCLLSADSAALNSANGLHAC